MDYYSKYIEVDKLKNLSSAATTDAHKSQNESTRYWKKKFHLMMRHSSHHVNLRFSADYQIEHCTSSTAFPQSNGETERAVQTVKRVWRKCTDKHLALLDYRTTQLESCNLSPAQLVMSRRPRNKLLIARELLKPTTYNVIKVRHSLDRDKEKQRHYHNKKASGDLPVLLPGDQVRMAPFPGSKKWLHTTVVSQHQVPRSYAVEQYGKKYRCNRRHLRLSMRCTLSSNMEKNILLTDDTFDCQQMYSRIEPEISSERT